MELGYCGPSRALARMRDPRRLFAMLILRLKGLADGMVAHLEVRLENLLRLARSLEGWWFPHFGTWSTTDKCVFAKEMEIGHVGQTESRILVQRSRDKERMQIEA